MSRYVIQGDRPIHGRIRPCGNKNAALPCLAATLLTNETVRLRNIPALEDVTAMLEILEALGATVRRTGVHDVEVTTHDIRTSEVPADLARKIRASILFAGPLVARTGRAVFPFPGGDVIGRRRLDTHVLALREYGASVELDGFFRVQAVKLSGKDIFLDEASVTATENAIMAGVLADGETTLRNAASEPHIQDLCRMLCEMGARIEGIGSNILRIRGVRSLGGTDFTIGPDYMEVGSFIGLAAATGGDVEIEDAAPDQQRMTAIQFAKLGIRWETQGGTIHVPRGQELRVNPDLGGLVPKIDDAPWPGFPPDLTSIALVVATQVRRDDPRSRKDVRRADVLCGQAHRHGRAHHPLRPPQGGRGGAVAAARRRARVAGHPGGHGDGDRRPLRGGPQHDQQRLPDRAGLRRHLQPAFGASAPPSSGRSRLRAPAGRQSTVSASPLSSRAARRGVRSSASTSRSPRAKRASTNCRFSSLSIRRVSQAP